MLRLFECFATGWPTASYLPFLLQINSMPTCWNGFLCTTLPPWLFMCCSHAEAEAEARLSSRCPQANCQNTSTWCICTLHVTRERKPAGSANRDQPKVKVRTMKYCIHACISGAKPAAEPLTPCYAPVSEAFTGLWETLNTLQRIQTSL